MAPDAQDDLTAALEERSRRGTPRGSRAVVDGAWHASLDVPSMTAERPVHRSSRATRVLGAAAIIALVVGAVVVVRASRDEPSPVDTTPAATIPSSSWTRLGALPLEAGYVNATTEAVWTGTEMIVPGGLTVRGNGADEIGESPAYNPATNSWRLIAAPPVRLPLDNMAPTVLWTGREVIYLTHDYAGPGSETGTGKRTGIAYDPRADQWRVIAQPPELRGAVWTGDAVLAWLADGTVSRYHPVTDSWDAPSGTAPVAPGELGGETLWVGGRMVVLTRAGTFAYDPVTSAWATGPVPPVYGGQLVAVGPTAYLVDGDGGTLSSLDIASMTWTARAPLPVRDRSYLHTVVAINGRLAVWGGQHFDYSPGSAPPAKRGDGALYDPATETWSAMPELPADLPANVGGVAADGTLIAWGATGGTVPLSQTGLIAAAWRPPTTGTAPQRSNSGSKPSLPPLSPATAPKTTAPDSPPGSTDRASRPTVSVLIYSGRSDPEWTPTESEQAQINATLDNLSPMATTDPPPGGLGYLGFTVSGLAGDSSNSRTIVLRYQVIVSTPDGRSTTLADPNSTALRLLEKLALQHVDDFGARSAIEESMGIRPARTTPSTAF